MNDCYHCGALCGTAAITIDQKVFCCQGCKMVYEILSEHDLTNYYDIEASPGVNPEGIAHSFDYLKNPDIVTRLLDFDEQGIQSITLSIPAIHCSSCIWILENLSKLHAGVRNSQVDFPKKEIRVTYDPEALTLYELVCLLCNIGYQPHISLEEGTEKISKKDRSLIYKIGVAGFAFGNIMFLSFPEYFEVSEYWLDRYKTVFRWLMFAFSLPVVFYSGSHYFRAAYKGLRSKILTIDVPIALGIAVLFIRSSIEIIFDLGTGFFDSLSGLVFFLLLGTFFQQKTYAFLSFERDYKSYFPLAVTRLTKTQAKPTANITELEEQIAVNELRPGDRILIRNQELIPVDAVLESGHALIDYSFVTGEAVPVVKQVGDKIFAGGRQQAGPLQLVVSKALDQSYLTRLWSNEIFDKNKQAFFETLTDQISKRFTIAILTIAGLSGFFWLWYDASMALNVFTAVLIVACPCAIALAAPFTLGNLLRIFGKQQCYIKNTKVIEQLATIDTIVFDKTGTLTTTAKNTIRYEGIDLTEEEKSILTSTLRSSSHPLSRQLYTWLKDHQIRTLDDFQEAIGEGVQGRSGKDKVMAGSLGYVSPKHTRPWTQDQRQEQGFSSLDQTAVHVSANQDYKGRFVFKNEYRKGMRELFNQLSQDHDLFVLSGDNDSEKHFLSAQLPLKTGLYFNQTPANKLGFIKKLQEEGRKVMMIGDGLNDAGALAQSDVGVVLSENINVFSPACDIILDASRFNAVSMMGTLARKGIQIIKYAFIFSLCYNLVGLAFAISGHLKPVVAAILMPLSSISIVVFTTFLTYLIGKKLDRKQRLSPQKRNN